MVWDVAINVASSLLPSLAEQLFGRGKGSQTLTIPVPKPVVPSGPAMLYEGRTVVPIFTQQGVVLNPGYTQAYDTTTGRRIVVAKSKLREIATAPAAPTLADVTRLVTEAIRALPAPIVKVPPAPAAPRTVQPPSKPAPIPTGEIIEYGGKTFAAILTEPGASLAPGARQAIDLATGKRAVLPASAVAKKAPEPALPPPAPVLPEPTDVLGALMDFGKAEAKRVAKKEAIEQWAIQRTAAVTRDPLNIGEVFGTEGASPAVGGRPAVRSPVPVVGGVPATRPPINLPSPTLPRQLPNLGTGAATAAGAGGAIAAIIASQGCIPVCEPEKTEKQKEQQRKARLPRKSCRQILEELTRCPCSRDSAAKPPGQSSAVARRP